MSEATSGRGFTFSAGLQINHAVSSSAQIFSKGSVHAVIRLGKSTFKTRAVRAAPTVAWQETGYLYIRCGSSFASGRCTLARHKPLTVCGRNSVCNSATVAFSCLHYRATTF